YLYEIYIPDTEREAIATQLQNPEFVQRFSVQVKQMLVKHGAKHEGFADPKRIRVVSLLPELEPFVQAMSTTLQDYTVTLWNPFRHVEVPSALAAQVEREGNPTAWAVPMGLAVRSLTIVDWF